MEKKKNPDRQTDELKKGGQIVKLTDEWTDRQMVDRPTELIFSTFSF